MLPRKTCFQLGRIDVNPTKVISLRIPDDLAARLTQNDSFKIHLDPSDPAQNKMMLGGAVFQLTIAPETQSVDVTRSSLNRKSIQVVGRVREKLSVKQELASEKALAIRTETEKAEKERLSRKTMTIDEPLKNSGNNGRTKIRNVSMAAAPLNGGSSRNRLMKKVSGAKAVTMSPRPTRPSPPSNSASEGLEKSSTNSWSPPIDVFSKPPEPTASSEPKMKRSRSNVAAGKESQTISTEATREKTVDPVYAKLHSEFQEKAAAYKRLHEWIDTRLSIFVQLDKDLALATQSNSKTAARIAQRVDQENKALQADKEYKWKSAEMAQTGEELEKLRSRISQLTEISRSEGCL